MMTMTTKLNKKGKWVGEIQKDGVTYGYASNDTERHVYCKLGLIRTLATYGEDPMHFFDYEEAVVYSYKTFLNVFKAEEAEKVAREAQGHMYDENGNKIELLF